MCCTTLGQKLVAVYLMDKLVGTAQKVAAAHTRRNALETQQWATWNAGQRCHVAIEPWLQPRTHRRVKVAWLVHCACDGVAQ